MSARSDQAVVIRLSDYSETSQIASLFTAGDGLVRLIAKGVKRTTKTRVAVGLDLLEFGNVEFVAARGDAGLGTLTGWVQRDAFAAIRAEMPRLYGGLYAAELLHALTQEHDPHPELFDATLALLRRLAGTSDEPDPMPPAAAIVRFQADLLTSIGFAPNLRQCVSCGRARVRASPAFFSSSAGGLVCKDCAPRQREKHEIAATLVDGPKGSTTAGQWFGLLDYHLTCIAGRPMQTGATLRAMI